MKFFTRYVLILVIAAFMTPTFAQNHRAFIKKVPVTTAPAETRFLHGIVELIYWEGNVRIWSYFSDRGASCHIKVSADAGFYQVVALANICDQSAPIA